ncbi:MAG: LCP family protein [Eubacterium sp.]|nr:LCP family protein [Eubacterium sp.]
MKKPIDPGLFDNDGEDLLLASAEEETPSFSINDKPKPKAAEPHFVVTEKVKSAAAEPAKSEPAPTAEPAKETAKEAAAETAEEAAKATAAEAATETAATAESSSSHHHSSSDGSSHHHSSSSSSHHHSSSGSSSHHHSSSGSSSHHHSSSGSSSHHHSSSGSSSHHHSSSSSSKKKKKSKLPTAVKIVIAVLLLLLLLVAIVIGTFLVLRAQGHKDITTVQDVQYEEVIEYNGHHYKYNDNMATFAFIGVDRRQFLDAEDTDFVGSADADIVVAVDTETGTSSVVAIPRDTITDINITTASGVFVRTSQAQLCLSYAYGDGQSGSCENTTSAMSRILLNVPIQKYVALDLDGIAPLNDAIGGVTLTAQYDIPDEDIYAGETVTLRGNAAEAYVRRRDMDSADAAVDRSDRQVQYIKAYAQQLLPSIVKDFSTVSTLYNTAMSYTQTNISLSNVTYMASFLLSKGVDDFATYRLEGEAVAIPDSLIPGVAHAEFYVDEDNVMETVLAVFYTQID